jgi:deoxyribodipyrimidine photo-lyase
VRHWLPELNNVPDQKVHEPHTLTKEEQQELGVAIGKDYPEPMIDLETSYREIRKRD